MVLWWIGQNFWNISVYVKDARSMELPLVGGGYHDWNYLLDAVGLLHRDQQTGQVVFGLGVLTPAGASTDSTCPALPSKRAPFVALASAPPVLLSRRLALADKAPPSAQPTTSPRPKG